MVIADSVICLCTSAPTCPSVKCHPVNMDNEAFSRQGAGHVWLRFLPSFICRVLIISAFWCRGKQGGDWQLGWSWAVPLPPPPIWVHTAWEEQEKKETEDNTITMVHLIILLPSTDSIAELMSWIKFLPPKQCCSQCTDNKCILYCVKATK